MLIMMPAVSQQQHFSAGILLAPCDILYFKQAYCLLCEQVLDPASQILLAWCSHATQTHAHLQVWTQLPLFVDYDRFEVMEGS